MKPLKHVVASFSLGLLIWYLTKNFVAGFLCFAAGVTPDFDHAIEHIIHFGWKDLSIKNVYIATEHTNTRKGNRQYKKLFLLFHSNELAIFLWILAVITANVYIIAIAAGYASHIILDYLGNKPYTATYFMSWRAISGFHTDKLMKPHFMHKHRKKKK